jgi:non-ribosomal peptide synthetase component E (peptide arylation enzyme)
MQQASYVHGASDKLLIGNTIGRHLDQIAEKYPERPAVIVRHQNIRLTYSELRQPKASSPSGYALANVSASGRRTISNGFSPSLPAQKRG